MKKILSLLGTITLIGTSTTSLVACNKPNNKIIFCEKKDYGNWKQECSINRPFSILDDKWYFIIWRSNENADWRIVKFNNSSTKKLILDSHDIFYLGFRNGDLHITEDKILFRDWPWILNVSKSHFKSVYRWEGKGEPDTPIIDPKTGEITDWNKVKEVKKDK